MRNASGARCCPAGGGSCIWRFALTIEMTRGAEEWLTRSLRVLRLDTELQTWTDLEGHLPDEMAHADLLFVGGGNAFQLLHHVRRHGFEQSVRDFVAGAATTTAAALAPFSRAPTSGSRPVLTRTGWD